MKRSAMPSEPRAKRSSAVLFILASLALNPWSMATLFGHPFRGFRYAVLLLELAALIVGLWLLLSPRRLSKSLKLFGVILLLLGSAGCVLTVWDRRPDPRPADLPDFSLTIPEHGEFERSANLLLTESFISDQGLKRAAARLGRWGLSGRGKMKVRGQFVRELMRLGFLDEAVAEVEAMMKSSDRLDTRSLAELHFLRGLVYLRQAEVSNCIEAHCAQSCIYPFFEGGVHANAEPGRMAKESFTRSHELAPQAKTAWMLSIVKGFLGEDAPPPTDGPLPRFPEVAVESGFVSVGLSGGVVAEDFDGDDLLDIVVTNSDPRRPARYYQNLGGLQFRQKQSEVLGGQLGGLHCNAVDYDNDGDTDLFILRGAWHGQRGAIRNSLLENQGNGEFVDVTQKAGLAFPAYPTQAAAWGDFDNDGRLDLYVANEGPRLSWSGKSAEATVGYPAQLFHNNGDGTFTNLAEAAGATNDRPAKGVTVGDFNNDGQLDIYVSNFTVGNRLYRNNGDGTFSDVAEQAGVLGRKRSFATWFFDYDNDGHLDLMTCEYAGFSRSLPTLEQAVVGVHLYRNLGQERFREVTSEVGFSSPIQAMGAGFGDLDNDGFQDLYFGTGGPRLEFLLPNRMFLNLRGRSFQEVTAAGGFGHLQKGHGISFADLDNDGDQDVLAQMGGAFLADNYQDALFKNPGNKNHFCVVRLKGRESNRNGFGARIQLTVLEDGQARTVTRSVGSISSFGYTPVRQEIGLGQATSIRKLEVFWPASGELQVYENLPVDHRIEIVEGESSPRLKDLRVP